VCLGAGVRKFISAGQTNGGPSAVHLYVTEAARYPTSVGTTTPSRAELVARAIELQPLLREHAAQMDAQRQLSDGVNTALVDAGLFRLLTPKRFGGYESGLRTAVEVTAELGAADGSTAWLVGIGTGAAWLLGMFSKEAQEAVFEADPDARIAGSGTPAVARRVEGGLRMSGRWENASGARHATWATITAVVHGNTGDVVDAVMAAVPVSELRLEDTWHTVGMRGTGSNTWVGHDIFVPEHMVMPVAALVDETRPSPTSEPMYQLPFSGPSTLLLVAPALGMGYAALNLAVDRAPTKGISQTSYPRQTDSVAVQIQIGQAALKLETARLHVYHAADELDAASARGDRTDYHTRAEIRARAGYAAQLVVDAMTILVNVHGAGSFAESNRMQQYWRDANIAARHPGLNAMIGYEIYGKALLGVEERIGRMV
jgi:3-hydroxy-9,10-secoandrosta-1,3,5(10)-triene-9,17-dione monooxygenase